MVYLLGSRMTILSKNLNLNLDMNMNLIMIMIKIKIMITSAYCDSSTHSLITT